MFVFRKIGFHIFMSPKFRNKEFSILLSFYFPDVLKTYFYKFSFRMGSSFCESTLQFLTLCVTRHLRDGRESSHVG